MRQIRKAVVALALMGGLAACSEDQASPDAAPDEDNETTSEAPAGTCEAVAYDRELAPGCWAIQARGLPDSPLAELDLPAGFTGNDAWVWVNAEEDEWGALTVMPVGAVYPDPCARAGQPPELGPSVQDFARALAAQKVTTTTTPAPVSLDGHDGVELSLSVPAGFDSGACRGKELRLWETEGEEYAAADPSFVSRFWVLDVDGQRVVLIANTNTSATDKTVDLFTGIAEAATFDES